MRTTVSMIALAVLFTLAGYAAASALNPQPLPPYKHPIQTSTHRLNPQPLPPG